mgnify:CR=1 FL=1
MFMKTLFTFIFIIISPNIFASTLDEWNKWYKEKVNNKTIKGEMTCKITDQVIMDVKDGKPIRYSSYKDQAKVGDRLSLIYSSIGDKISIKLTHPSEQYIDTSISAEKGKGSDKKMVFFNNNPDGKMRHYYNTMSIYDDLMKYKNHNFIGSKTIYMTRYYKSDWDGIFTGLYGNQTHIFTFDCRNIVDKIDEIIDRFNTYPGRLIYKKEKK